MGKIRYITSIYFIIITYFFLFVNNKIDAIPLIASGSGPGSVLFMGAVQYPQLIEKIPMIRIYRGGNKIKSEIHEEGKKLNFSISESRYQTKFYILVSEKIDFVTDKGVVLYLKVPTLAPYKLYELELVKSDVLPDLLQDAQGFKHEPKVIYRWEIREGMMLSENGRIPDDAIIIYQNPAHISRVEGDYAGEVGAAAYDLPRIVMRSDLLDIVGSEKELHELSNKQLLSAIDFDPLHASITQEITHKAKTIVALTT